MDGYKNFPFFRIELENDPGPASAGHKQNIENSVGGKT